MFSIPKKFYVDKLLVCACPSEPVCGLFTFCTTRQFLQPKNNWRVLGTFSLTEHSFSVIHSRLWWIIRDETRTVCYRAMMRVTRRHRSSLIPSCSCFQRRPVRSQLARGRRRGRTREPVIPQCSPSDTSRTVRRMCRQFNTAFDISWSPTPIVWRKSETIGEWVVFVVAFSTFWG